MSWMSSWPTWKSSGTSTWRKWGQLSVLSEQRGRTRPINDTWMAACCLVAGLPLATLNLKDFEDFAEHDDLRIIGANER
jgi:toxin FitB